MKSVLITLLLVMAVGVALAGESFAMDNKLEVSARSGTGDSYTLGSYDLASYGLSYTRFIQPLEDNGEPYGAREFLQHPSLLSVSMERVSYDFSPLLPDLPYETETDGFTVSGIHYLGEGRKTGLGLSYSLKESEVTDPGSPNTKENSLELAVRHYLTDGLRVGLGYERRDWDYSNDAVWNVYSIDASALIEKYWLSSWYDKTKVENPGGVDHEEMGAELGIYPMRELGVFASYKVLWEMMESTTTFGLRTEYWPSEMTAITLAYFRARVELSHIDEDSGKVMFALLF